MNQAALSTFLAILRTGNLNRAAAQLNVTQSTVTARLNSLEEELGQRLFHRKKSGAELTSAGFKFSRYAELMTELWRQARQETSLPPDIEAICNIGCHFDLWPGTGRRLFDRIRDTQPKVAMSTWPGEQRDLDHWLDTGLVDVALCFASTLREHWTTVPLLEDRLVLVSTVARELVRWDPSYIYVDSGEEFRRKHAAAYPDGDTPTVIFGSSVWALEYLMERGGSGYLPERLIAGRISEGSLHPVPGAPEFTRHAFLVVRNDASANWPWLAPLVAELSVESGP